VAQLALPPCDEPPDFRRQAPGYARYRRNYSEALYAAIEERTGRASGRPALDLGCGTGLVASSLRERGWSVVGIDFSRAMLGQARNALTPDFPLVRARSEALPLVGRRFALLTCGTAFHWFAPQPSLAEMTRVLTDGGWAALFWRHARPGEPTVRIVREILGRLGCRLPAEPLTMHPTKPFRGSALVPEAELRLETTLDYTPESFHGYVATTEFLRRVAGAQHERFLAELRGEVERRYPRGLAERCREHLFLARRRPTRARQGSGGDRRSGISDRAARSGLR
jgi:SAM-dependent methyltransferase